MAFWIQTWVLIPEKPKPQNNTVEPYTSKISVAYGSMAGTTISGWYWRIDSTNTNTLTERHIVIQKGKLKYAQNISGRPHDGNSGSPPNTVKKEIKKQGIWDWDANDAKRPKISKCTSFISLDTYYANQQLQNNFYLGVCCVPGSTFSEVLSTSAATSGSLAWAFSFL